MRKKLLLPLLCAALILVLLLIADFFGLRGPEVSVTVPEGSRATDIVRLLKENKVIQFKLPFRFYIHDDAAHLKAGVHGFRQNMGYKNALSELKRNVPLGNEISVTIPEGFEAREIAQILETSGLMGGEAFLSACKEANKTFDFLPSDGNIEGYLFPDTYSFEPDTTAAEICAKMVETFREKMYTKENLRLCDAQGYSFHEALTLASIVEREAAKDEERPIVASVFHNRLKKGMHLESCATVQYILKERKDVLSYADTKIESPYNTYKNAGLPPSPIASPGIPSLSAALSPAKTNYLFFVADGTGGHVFTETYNEHLQAVSSVQ